MGPRASSEVKGYGIHALILTESLGEKRQFFKEYLEVGSRGSFRKILLSSCKLFLDYVDFFFFSKGVHCVHLCV